MNKTIQTLILAAWALAATPSFAAHGALLGVDRDAWINARVQALVDSGKFLGPNKPVAEWTNLEVARATAAEVEKTQDASSKPGNDAADLVGEFKPEIAAMGVDLAKLEARLAAAHKRNASYKDQQEILRRKTGTQLSGDARAYFSDGRGFGPNALMGVTNPFDVFYIDLRLKSVPAPKVLFDAQVRFTRTIGFQYVDPISTNWSIRWLDLGWFGDDFKFHAGDFWRSYTPLTLWNTDVPVYTLVEPTVLKRARQNLEEFLYLDHGNDWRMRGLEASEDHAWDGAVVKAVHAQAMGGTVRRAFTGIFDEDYGGSQAGFDLFGDKLEVRGTGLVLQSLRGTALAPYNPNDFSTTAKRQSVVSASAKLVLTLPAEVLATASGEWARAKYEEDLENPARSLSDWAVRGEGAFERKGLKLSWKYLNNGPDFLSPGAQTNRWTPKATVGYQGSASNLDEGLIGYRNIDVFQQVARPTYAAYDRLDENLLPYGDATPNREALLLGFAGALGNDGWLQPQLSVAVKAKEFQPNDVMTGIGGTVLPVDSQTATATARSFGRLEAAVTADLSKAWDKAPKNCVLTGDYKRMTNDLGLGDAFKVDSWFAGADVGPLPYLKFLRGIVFSASYGQTKARGSEYALTGIANQPSLAGYATPYDTTSLGTYGYQALNLTRSTLAFGAQVKLGKNFLIHADWFSHKWSWVDQPKYDRRDQTWKLTNELSF